jgi:hypothetical protein
MMVETGMMVAPVGGGAPGADTEHRLHVDMV